MTLHYLCLVLLAQADAASHCVFVMRNHYEAEEEETQPGEQSELLVGSVCVLWRWEVNTVQHADSLVNKDQGHKKHLACCGQVKYRHTHKQTDIRSARRLQCK